MFPKECDVMGILILGPEITASPVKVTSTHGLTGSSDSIEIIVFNVPISVGA